MLILHDFRLLLFERFVYVFIVMFTKLFIVFQYHAQKFRVITEKTFSLFVSKEEFSLQNNNNNNNNDLVYLREVCSTRLASMTRYSWDAFVRQQLTQHYE